MICHVDADAFFASVLQRLHPRLRGKPLFALGMGGTFIIAASYEAKAKGVKTGMHLREARRLCPGAAEMPSDFRETALASEQIEAALQKVCPVIEQMSIDEWYLDLRSCIGGVPADLEAFGRTLQQTVLRTVGLSVSVGISATKLLSKLAGETRKPAGVTVVHPSKIREFLRTRPLEAICGMGRRRCIPARAQGWNTAEDMAAANPALVQRLFGKSGTDMQRELLGDVMNPVCNETAPPKSISRCRSFPRTNDRALLWGHLLHHLSRTVLKMRKWHLAATHVSIWLRDADLHGHGLTVRLAQPCAEEEGFLDAMHRCFTELSSRATRFSQAGLGLSGLVPHHARQISLFDPVEKDEKDTQLQKALDNVRGKFGRETITRAAALNTAEEERPTLAMPIMEMDDDVSMMMPVHVAGQRHRM